MATNRGVFLTVEVMAGTSEAEAARDLLRLAQRLDILVEAKHNGTLMMAFPSDSVEDVVQRFDRERRLENYPQS